MSDLFVKGGPLMWPLAVLSFAAVTFVVERALFYWKVSRGKNARQRSLILEAVERGDLEEAEFLAGTSKNDFVIRTLLHGLAHRRVSLTQALETQALTEMRRLNKNLSVLDTVITAAPLLGILGTVLGIILSFDVLGKSGVSDPMAVTQGISQALITTAFGLAIALTTLLPYNFFQSRCQRATEELERYSSILEILMHKEKEEVLVP